MPPSFSPQVTTAIHAAAAATGVAEGLLRAVVWIESSGKPDALGAQLKNGMRARGLMQLIDSVAAQYGVVDAFSPEQNALGGAKHLKQLLKRYGGDAEDALAAYNWGGTHVDQAKQDGKPYPTQVLRYVQKVKDRWAVEDRGGAYDPLPVPPLTAAVSGSCSHSCSLHCTPASADESGKA